MTYSAKMTPGLNAELEVYFDRLLRVFMPEYLKKVSLEHVSVDAGKQNLEALACIVSKFKQSPDLITGSFIGTTLSTGAEAVLNTLDHLINNCESDCQKPLFPLLREAKDFRFGNQVMCAVYKKVDVFHCKNPPLGYTKCKISGLIDLLEPNSIINIEPLVTLAETDFIPRDITLCSSLIMTMCEFSYFSKKDSREFFELWVYNTADPAIFGVPVVLYS